MRRLSHILSFLTVALFLLSVGSAAKADGVDPAVGLEGGSGSTALFGPTFSFTFTGTQGTSITQQNFDFINSTGSTVGEVDLLGPAFPDPGSPPILTPLTYVCGPVTAYFSTCMTTLLTSGQTLIRYFGGTGIPNDPNPNCVPNEVGPPTCTPSVPAADFIIFVRALNGDLSSLPTADRFTVPGTLIPAPEPATLMLISTGLGCVALIRRRRQKTVD